MKQVVKFASLASGLLVAGLLQRKARLGWYRIQILTSLAAVGATGLILAGCGGGGSSSPVVTSGAAPVFSQSTAITNPYLPLASFNQHILEGTEDGEVVRVERTRKEGTKTFTVNGRTVAALIVEDRAFVNGELVEVALDYYAQADDGTVYYLGEDVDDYENDQIVGHGGAWLFGVHTQTLGVIMPGNPKIGDKFKVEDVPGITQEDAEVVSLSETATVPAGTFTNCVRIKETHPGGVIEYKLYAPGVGVVKEEPEDGVVSLRSHR
jgi:hypothetical protein